jgi:hypothetical protein
MIKKYIQFIKENINSDLYDMITLAFSKFDDNDIEYNINKLVGLSEKEYKQYKVGYQISIDDDYDENLLKNILKNFKNYKVEHEFMYFVNIYEIMIMNKNDILEYILEDDETIMKVSEFSYKFLSDIEKIDLTFYYQNTKLLEHDEDDYYYINVDIVEEIYNEILHEINLNNAVILFILFMEDLFDVKIKSYHY